MRFGHFSDQGVNQGFSRLGEFFESDGLGRHALERAMEFTRNGFAVGLKHFECGAVMAQQIDYEGAAERLIDPLVGKKFLHVKKVARVLAVESGDHLSGIEVGERNKAHFRKSKCFLNGCGDGTQFRVIDTAAQYRRDFNLDLRALQPSQQPGECFFGFQ